MFEIIHKEPLDIRYPLDKKTYLCQNIFYHGTRSCFQERIDSQGWLINNPPYDIAQIANLRDLMVERGLQDTVPFRVLDIMTLGQRDQQRRKRPSFTRSYWQALFPYAFNLAGETISAIFDGIDLLLALDLDTNTIDDLNRIRTHYQKLIQGAYPVVYIVVLARGDYTPIIGKDDVVTEIDIPPDRIITRVDFPNNLSWFYVPADPLPLPWDMKLFLKYLSELGEGPVIQRYIELFKEKTT